DQSLRLEAIQFVGGTGAEADKGHLRQILNDAVNAHDIAIRKLGGGPGRTAYHLPNGKAVIAEFLSSPDRSNRADYKFLHSPNALYYHTEGSPPGLGQNDDGKIDPGNHSSFKITSIAVG